MKHDYSIICLGKKSRETCFKCKHLGWLREEFSMTYELKYRCKSYNIDISFDNNEDKISDKDKTDNVNHPVHYAETVPGIECIEVTRNFNFNRGNAIKYIWRAGYKSDEIEDLKKAIWYLNDEVNKLQEVSR